MTTRTVFILLAAVIALLLLILWVSGLGYQGRQAKALIALGDREVPTLPIYREWVDSLSACLKDGMTFDPKARYFIGTKIPQSWLDNNQSAKDDGAYTNVKAHLVLFAPPQITVSLFKHEAWHVSHGEGHPAALFYPPVCGMAPA